MTPLSGLGALIVLWAIALIVALPRRWAPLPLLMGTFYMTLSQGIELGPFNVFAIRLLLLAGLLRAGVRGERPANFNGIDKLMLAWALWAAASSAFHADPLMALKANLGLAFNACGCYFLLRAWCTSRDDVVRLAACTVLLLVPVGLEMLGEQLTHRDAFAVLGGVPDEPQVREGRLRAQGPFGHAILAGTVGAVCLPLAIGLWRSHRRTALAGIAACTAMVVSSASSGPALSSLFALFALALWPLRRRMRLLRWAAACAWLGLSLAMSAPVYYLLARIDLAGGSTGWYRARLIESSIEHLNEWWLGGTDVTGHWMATGVDEDHADITNQYIFMGVSGGLLLMGLFVLTLAAAFRAVGQGVERADLGLERPVAAKFTPPEARPAAPLPGLAVPVPMQPTASCAGGFFAWAFGTSLFAHVTTFFSVSYFDQSFVFLYLGLAGIASLAPQAESALVRELRPLIPSGAARFGSRRRTPPTTGAPVAWPYSRRTRP